MRIASPRSLYVHIPFCERKCHYCDFVSVAGRRNEAEYVDALCREIVSLGAASTTELDTVFMGGGTPSWIDPPRLAAVLAAVRANFALSPTAEITLEANPSSTTAARAAAWRKAGFNRISLGVQSFDAGVLGFLGRIHDGARAVAAVAEVRQGGFTQINCDLIYAVPGLDDVLWQTTLTQMLDLDPGHISCYELTVEPGTPLYRMVATGRTASTDAETALRQHRIAVATLGAAGYPQYEVSNFARPGQACLHNLAYWRNQTYFAAGAGAHGHVDPTTAVSLGFDVDPAATAVRYWHPSSIRDFVLASAASGHLPVAGTETVTALEHRAEAIMLGLRLCHGVVGDGLDPAEVDTLVEAGLLRRTGGRVAASPRGQEVLNQLVTRLAMTPLPTA